MPPAMNGCSVVVCTYNRLSYLKKAIPALLAQSYEPYELLFVDDGSVDGTAEFLDALTLQDPRVRVLHHGQNLGLSEARNSGARAARYDVVAYIDDDCLAAPDWLSQLVSTLERSGADFVSGRVVYVREGYRAYFPERCVQNPGARWPMGGNAAFRKEVYAKAGYADPTYFWYNNEDTEMAIRAVSQGLRFASAPDAVIFHQAQAWTVPQLLRSARNASVWPRLKKAYPRHYLAFHPPILWGVVVNPLDWLWIALLPLLVPVLLVRYFLHGKRDLRLFFTKWPVWLLLRRFYVIREAIRNRVFMF